MLADITAQVERERRLRQSEAWLNAALTGIHDHAAVGLDAEGRIAHWSESAARMTGFARETVLATGGLGQIYLHTTNPRSARGDGLAIAARRAAEAVRLIYASGKL